MNKPLICLPLITFTLLTACGGGEGVSPQSIESMQRLLPQSPVSGASDSLNGFWLVLSSTTSEGHSEYGNASSYDEGRQLALVSEDENGVRLHLCASDYYMEFDEVSLIREGQQLAYDVEYGSEEEGDWYYEHFAAEITGNHRFTGTAKVGNLDSDRESEAEDVTNIVAVKLSNALTLTELASEVSLDLYLSVNDQALTTAELANDIICAGSSTGRVRGSVDGIQYDFDSTYVAALTDNDFEDIKYSALRGAETIDDQILLSQDLIPTPETPVFIRECDLYCEEVIRGSIDSENISAFDSEGFELHSEISASRPDGATFEWRFNLEEN
ncbi:hypothetical protein [uncultured Thalassolituus sp.]|uniref:hypothetical protein n=1 Tax=uncultured Thalassolituus sp. TaxID=285273 RepID=UPI00262FC778|nr:hypothetical protein [uncultured Thalassolituus sp.]